MSIALRGLKSDVRAAAEWCLGVAAQNGVNVTVTSVNRTWVQQLALRRRYESCVAQGRFPTRGVCEFPAARPGESAHNYGLAWDSVVEPYLIPWWTEVRKLAGFHVPASDWIHAEYPNWRAYVS